MVMGELDIGKRLVTLPSKEDILGVTVQDMHIGMKRSTTVPCSMFDKLLMVLGEVYLCLRSTTLSTIIQVIMVDHMDFIVMVITEVCIGLTPSNFLYRTMVY